ncbi:hypothetical protein [Mucisphaera calidilacus]|uniref:Uncharacterized protein n=1 Tax=Mucisphaera calidilacus TaxID=2527982 RepID=A0A518C148_9BACT|nr:hypothetical protein [Mucisphaera calidilacus]QDU72957.1 hypothetical protein Pan265_28340 [Mucisphaera calidilacus]
MLSAPRPGPLTAADIHENLRDTGTGIAMVRRPDHLAGFANGCCGTTGCGD